MRYTPISELYRQVRERKLTPQEIEDREKIAKKLPIKDFEKRYGKKKGMQVKMATATNIVKKKSEKSEVKEDGHQDVASAIRQCKTVTEDAMQILQKLKSMSPEDSLPSWWTNKLAVASNSMNKLRDYFLVPSVSEEVELNEAEVSVFGFISTGARKKFLDNLNDMRLQFTSKLMNLPQPAPPSGVLKFDANQSTIEAIIKFAKRMKLKIIKENIDEELDKDDEDTVKTIIGKLKKASKAHAGQAKQLSKDLQDDKELDEMKYTHAVVDFKRSLKKFSDAKVIGFTTNEKDAKFMAKNALTGTKGTVVKLKKPMSQKKGDMMINRPLEEEVELSEAPKGTPKPKVEKTRGGFQVMVYSPSSKKYIPQGQPHKNQKDAEKDAKTFEGYDHIKEMIQSGKFTRPEIKKMIVRNILEKKAATGYTIFHKTFSDAMQHAYAHAKSKMGMTVDKKEIDDKVATGPKKPGVGKTNRYSLKTNKGMLQIQVYNRGGSKPFELNMYSS